MIPLPDLLLTNARVVTVDPANPTASCVLISDGVITYVGFETPPSEPGRVAIDLGGACLIPGFIDCHCHLRSLGQYLSAVDCSPARQGSIGEIVFALACSTRRGGWIVGRGYDQDRLAEKRHPDAEDLDRVSGLEPVLLIHSSGHGCTINSVAMHLAGIGIDTPDPPGGTIVRGQSGAPTGRLTESAMNLAFAAMPAPTRHSRADAIAAGSTHAASLGITSATESSADFDDLAALADTVLSERLQVRCSPWILAEQLRERCWPVRSEISGEYCGDLVDVRTAKIFMDGALGTRTALLRAPYADEPGNIGTAIWSENELLELAAGAASSGWQIAAHAIGDGAIDLAIKTFESLCEQGQLTHRQRIEHAMLAHPEQLSALRRLDVHPVFQPEFLLHFGDMYIDAVGSRAEKINPYRNAVAQGFPLSFSSDLPVVDGRPLVGMAAAVRRRTQSGRVLGPEQRVSPYEALEAYTTGAAYALGVELVRGKIKVGMQADMTLLTDNFLEIDPDAWGEIQTIATIMGGRFTFDPQRLSPL